MQNTKKNNKKISILNIRMGLACNSSSSHSILILNDKNDSYNSEDTQFDWDFFTAGDKESKNNYLSACLYSSISNLIPEEQQQDFLKQFFDIKDFDYDDYYNAPSVDHQSIITFPLDLKGNIHIEFIKDFQKFIEREDVVILGGNDNTDEVHHLTSKGTLFQEDYPKEDDPQNWIARKDKKNDFWTLFNRVNGSKIRLSFNGEQNIQKAYSPELVDIKITDFCPYSCEFCYQDSTLDGKHSSLEFIKHLADKLAEAEVFECCLGGGETTLHPNFIEILKTFYEKGIVVNFTTKNMNLLKSSQAEDILKYSGAIAFSAESVEDIEKVNSAFLEYKEKSHFNKKHSYSSVINIQYVMGSTPIEQFIDIVKESAKSKLNITLLGFKENGRGNSFNSYDYSTWLNEIRKINSELIEQRIYPRISIDTALAAQYQEEIEELGIDKRTYHTNEGGFSLYIDAVKKTMAPSSYIGFEQEVKFTDNWLNDYEKIFVEAPNEKPKKKIKIL